MWSSKDLVYYPTDDLLVAFFGDNSIDPSQKAYLERPLFPHGMISNKTFRDELCTSKGLRIS